MHNQNSILFQVPTKPKRWALAWKILKIIMVFYALVYIAIYGVPQFFDTVMDRVERQRIAEHAYYCQHYGAEMNKHAGRDVCP